MTKKDKDNMTVIVGITIGLVIVSSPVFCLGALKTKIGSEPDPSLSSISRGAISLPTAALEVDDAVLVSVVEIEVILELVGSCPSADPKSPELKPSMSLGNTWEVEL